MVSLSQVFGVGKRVLNSGAHLLFNERYSSKVTSAIQAQGRMAKAAGHSRFYQFHNQVGEGFLRAEKTPWAGLVDSCKAYGKDVSALWKGNSSFFAKCGGTLKGLAKRAPLIGTALMVAFEFPNIYRATKEEGIVGGAKEAGKAGVRLAAGMALGAVGTAVAGPIGSIAGFIIGDMIGKLVVGKSFTEKKEEKEKQMAMAQQGQQVQFTGAQPQGTAQAAAMNPFQQQQNMLMMQQMMSRDSFSDDFMLQSRGGQVNFLA